MRCPHCNKEINQETVRIKLAGTKKNKDKSFYEMITHGNTFSCIKDEFIVEEHLLERLDKKGLKYKRVK